MRIVILLFVCLYYSGVFAQTAHNGKVVSLAFNDSGTKLISASGTETIVWDMTTSKRSTTINMNASLVYWLTEKNKILIAGADGVYLMDDETFVVTDTIDSEKKLDGPYVVTPDGKYLFCRLRTSQSEAWLHAINLHDFSAIENLSNKKHKFFNNALVFSASSDSRYLYVLSNGVDIIQFSCENFSEITRFNITKVHSDISSAVCIAAGDEYLYVGGKSNSGTGGKEISRYLVNNQLIGFGASPISGGVRAIAYSPVLKTLFIAALDMKIYTLKDDVGVIEKFASLDRYPESLSVSIDGKFLAVGTGFAKKSTDNFPVLVFDIESGKVVLD
ncbi:MAG: WD40 repeat domain-containing protein [Crocinitomicaceae bacterium]|nr:WD40 repeat domain-containing protein [Crocinitomicaceae bacterium]MBK8924923.1 WD40 repeat domain-containing protein [Crocinitomicaceae bacterium]